MAQWTQPSTKGLPPIRFGHRHTTIKDKIYIFGGDDTRSLRNDVHVFNARKLKWDMLRPEKPPMPRSGHSLHASGKKLVVYGGMFQGLFTGAVDVYDIENDEWELGVAEGPVRVSHTSQVVGGQMVVFGGVDGPDGLGLDQQKMQEQLEAQGRNNKEWKPTKGGSRLDTVLTADLKKFKFTQEKVKSGPKARFNHASAVWQDRYMIVNGGVGGSITDYSSYLNDTWMLDVKKMKWKQIKAKGKVPPALYSHQLAVIDDTLYLYGGHASASGEYNEHVYALDLNSSEWTKVKINGDKPSARDGHSMSVIRGKLVVFAGYYHGDKHPLHVFHPNGADGSDPLDNDDGEQTKELEKAIKKAQKEAKKEGEGEEEEEGSEEEESEDDDRRSSRRSSRRSRRRDDSSEEEESSEEESEDSESYVSSSEEEGSDYESSD